MGRILYEKYTVESSLFVRGGPTFVDFMGHPYPRIYIPMNKLSFIDPYELK
jgi:hypothetical protein